MKFIKLHQSNTQIVYKNSICSLATLVVVTFMLLSFIIPLILISFVNPLASITNLESQLLYEQPKVQFKYQSMLFADLKQSTAALSPVTTANAGLLLCSTATQTANNYLKTADACNALKFWTEDTDHNGRVDRLHFIQEIDNFTQDITQLEWILWLDARLQAKCLLNPPTVLTASIQMPSPLYNMPAISTILSIEGDLVLVQNENFFCPVFGQNTKTIYQDIEFELPTMANAYQPYQRSAILQQLQQNSGYFDLIIREQYHRYGNAGDDARLRVQMQVNVRPIGVRYCQSRWQSLGPFWLYFFTFFLLSYYLLYRIKDYLFAKNVIRAWAIIPWKKLY